MPREKLVHRLREVREQANASLRSVARRTGIPIRTLQEQEVTNNIRLADLLRWKEALGVPFMELFCDSPERTDEMLRLRAGLIQVMRAVNSLGTTDLDERQEAIIQNLKRELQSMMPELEEIGAGPQYGTKRRLDEPARIESQIIATATWCPDIGNEV